jgi:hypothetical protein
MPELSHRFGLTRADVAQMTVADLQPYINALPGLRERDQQLDVAGQWVVAWIKAQAKG